MTVKPIVSVALCTYNGAKFIRPQLDSIINQTTPADEIIIIDDNSNDNTVDILKEYAQKYEIIKVFVNKNNLGFLDNFSLAISKTKGDFVALSDQDDIWAENHIELLLSKIGDNAICVGEAELIDSNGKRLGMTFNELRGNFCIPHSNISKAYKIIYNYNPYRGADMMINRKWVDAFLPIPPGVDYHDTFFSACASLTQGLEVIRDVVSYYRIHENQVTKRILNRVTLLDELKRRRHHVCFYNKVQIIKYLEERARNRMPLDALAFLDEFKTIQDLDKKGKRLQVLKILNSHYRQIYSCSKCKYIVPRSLHFLIAP